MQTKILWAVSAAMMAMVTTAAVGCGAPAAEPSGSDEQDSNSTSPGGKKKPSGDDNGGSTSSSSGGGSTSSSSGGSSSGGSTSGGGSTSSSGGAAPMCAAKANQDACYDCCEALTPDTQAAAKAEAAIDAEWQTCACAAARCASACATDYCKAGADPTDDPEDGSACAACLDGAKTDDCDDQTDAKYTALEATPGYQAWDKCETDSKCDTLPE